jgi:hypothetical protein
MQRIYRGVRPRRAIICGAAKRTRLRVSGLRRTSSKSAQTFVVVKKLLGHRDFIGWIDAEFGVSDDSVRRFMNVAEVYSGRNQITPDLPPTAVYELTPEPVCEAVR